MIRPYIPQRSIFHKSLILFQRYWLSQFFMVILAQNSQNQIPQRKIFTNFIWLIIVNFTQKCSIVFLNYYSLVFMTKCNWNDCRWHFNIYQFEMKFTAEVMKICTASASHQLQFIITTIILSLTLHCCYFVKRLWNSPGMITFCSKRSEM